MHRFSFKIRHRGCAESTFSTAFPKHHITVVDIQSRSPKEKQYFYYISGPPKEFDAIIKHLQNSKGYKLTREIERSSDTLLLLVVLHQQAYVQNIIQKYNGFFLEHHTVYGGYEYWHVGVLDRTAIQKMKKEIEKLGELKALYIGEVDFAPALLSSQQKKVFQSAYDQGYYKTPRKTTIVRIAKVLKLNPSTAGEHLLKAENKVISSVAKRI
ncbi:helix-turn-helix domain-containing protein [Candidatus Woesearchaeota archaeon]|nr:helix-turn-helix domain-containing protein [Candidatus Woesearchaeota archaeon]